MRFSVLTARPLQLLIDSIAAASSQRIRDKVGLSDTLLGLRGDEKRRPSWRNGRGIGERREEGGNMSEEMCEEMCEKVCEKIGKTVRRWVRR
jgi:hypothetical protein